MSRLANSVAGAYDALAPAYEAQLAQNPVARYLRRVVQAHLARLYPPGARVLDFTAGTGVDACFLAQRNVQVVAVDASPGMLAELRRAAAAAGLPVQSRVLPAGRLSELEPRSFDGAFSTFAGLNTVDDLDTLARDLHACLKPRSRVLLHALNRFCLWEAVLGQDPSPRRPRAVQVGGVPLVHRYYDPFELARTAFAPYFDLRAVYGLSVVAAPSLVRRLRPAAEVLFALDRAAGRLLPAAGDFFVLEMERRDAA